MANSTMQARAGTGTFRPETIWQDIRFGARQFWRNPGFALTAILTLSLGIGASTAVSAWLTES